jgi:hypothetical protein
MKPLLILLLSLSITISVLGQQDSLSDTGITNNHQINSSKATFHVKQVQTKQKPIFDIYDYIEIAYQCGYKNKEIIIDTNGMAFYRWGKSSSTDFSKDTALVSAIRALITPELFADYKSFIPNADFCCYDALKVIHRVTINSEFMAIDGQGKFNTSRLKKLIKLFDQTNKKYGFAKY